MLSWESNYGFELTMKGVLCNPKWWGCEIGIETGWHCGGFKQAFIWGLLVLQRFTFKFNFYVLVGVLLFQRIHRLNLTGFFVFDVQVKILVRIISIDEIFELFFKLKGLFNINLGGDLGEIRLCVFDLNEPQLKTWLWGQFGSRQRKRELQFQGAFY